MHGFSAQSFELLLILVVCNVAHETIDAARSVQGRDAAHQAKRSSAAAKTFASLEVFGSALSFVSPPVPVRQPFR